MYLTAGCKLFRQIEKYSKSMCFGQKIKPSSVYRLRISFINPHSSTENYFGNSWVKTLVSSSYHVVRQAKEDAH